MTGSSHCETKGGISSYPFVYLLYAQRDTTFLNIRSPCYALVWTGFMRAWVVLAQVSHTRVLASTSCFLLLPASKLPTPHTHQLAMEFVLRCNDLKCRSQLHDRAVVTTCRFVHHHCPSCASTTDNCTKPCVLQQLRRYHRAFEVYECASNLSSMQRITTQPGRCCCRGSQSIGRLQDIGTQWPKSDNHHGMCQPRLGIS
jgi:hypothetical protein